MLYNSRRERGRYYWLVIGLALCQNSGCGGLAVPEPETASVTGKVTFKGQPLELGTVTFQPKSGAFATADIEPDGTYSLTAVVGSNEVMIVSSEPEEEGAGASPGKRKIPKSFIPEKYASLATSGLKFEVESGDNTADFDLPE